MFLPTTHHPRFRSSLVTCRSRLRKIQSGKGWTDFFSINNLNFCVQKSGEKSELQEEQTHLESETNRLQGTENQSAGMRWRADWEPGTMVGQLWPGLAAMHWMWDLRPGCSRPTWRRILYVDESRYPTCWKCVHHGTGPSAPADESIDWRCQHQPSNCRSTKVLL